MSNCSTQKPVFSFLVTTDNHMGYKEDDHIRRKDSYQAFREALQIARDKNVDFILLGGDLFHTNRPSPNIEHKCIKIIRQHNNAKDIAKSETSFRRVAGKFSHFHKVDHANFEDPNLKVPYPIMTIHGNHDDPTGPRHQSVCEKLATCGLLNYFGAVSQKEKEITIEPIVLLKEHIKIALYGLGFIPDLKLKQAFDKGHVRFVEPPEDTYNVLIVHQNRVPFSKQKVIPDSLFPGFFHLIIRGHEHATLDPTSIIESPVGGIVYQPGSTVATSICPSEAAPKKVGLISITSNELHKESNQDKQNIYEMNYELVELKSCRPMIFKDISQKEIFKYTKKSANVSKISASQYKAHSRDYVIQCIKGLLDEWKKTKSTKAHSSDKLPLLRVRLEYVLRDERFDELDLRSMFFPSLVANSDIVLFKKQKLVVQDDGRSENVTFNDDQDEEDLEEFDHINLGDEKRDTIDVMIDSYFRDQPADQRLQALSLIEYTNAVKGSTEDGNVISKVLSKKKEDVLNKFKKQLLDEERAFKEFHDEEAVTKWFLTTFVQSDYKDLGGGDYDYIDAIELSD